MTTADTARQLAAEARGNVAESNWALWAMRALPLLDALANAEPAAGETAKQKYDRLRVEDEEHEPLEQLRAFLSLALRGQDWIDVEPFLDALAGSPAPSAQPVAEIYRGGMGGSFGKATVLCRWMAGAEGLPDGTHLLYLATPIVAPTVPARDL